MPYHGQALLPPNHFHIVYQLETPGRRLEPPSKPAEDVYGLLQHILKPQFYVTSFEKRTAIRPHRFNLLFCGIGHMERRRVMQNRSGFKPAVLIREGKRDTSDVIVQPGGHMRAP